MLSSFYKPNQKQEINIGIDLSTTNTGVSVFINGNHYRTFDFKLDTYSIGNIVYNNSRIRQVVWDEIFGHEIINEITVHNVVVIQVGIELSNFKNPQLTGRFNMYAGLLIAHFLEYANKVCFEGDNMYFKTFNSNA